MENAAQNDNTVIDGRIKILRGISVSLVCAAAAAAFFYGGYRMGNESIASPVSAPDKNAVSETETVTEEVSVAAEMPVYTVVSENGRLCLYETNSDGQTLIASESVSLEMFPSSDRDALLKGEEFSDLSEAQALFEDFAG